MSQSFIFERRGFGLPLFAGILFLLQLPNIVFAQSPCDCNFEITGNGTHLLSELLQEEVLPPLWFDGPCLKINGTLEIDEEYFFLGAGTNALTEIIMAPCAEIVVKAGVLSSMDYVYIHSCDDEMWKGITVERGELSGGGQSQGGHFQFNHNIISDAQYAVSAGHFSQVKIIDNDFVNNYVGFRVLAYEESPSPLSYVQFTTPFSPLDFTDNNFIFDGEEPYLEYCDLTDPVTDLGYAGIELNRATAFFIGDDDVTSYEVTNYFTGMRYGARVSGSTAIGLRSLIIEDLNDTGDDGAPVTQQTSTGVWISKSKEVEVKYSDIDDCRNGIVVALSGLKNVFRDNDVSVDNNAVYALNTNGELTIQDNTLSAANCAYVSTLKGTLDVTGNTGNFSNFGVYAFNLNGTYYIRDDTLHSVDSIPEGGTVGIHVQNAALVNGRIYENTVDLASSPQAQAETGIRLIDCYRTRVYDNSVEGEDGPSDNYLLSYGVWGTKLNRVTFCCNTVNKTNQGFSFQSVNNNMKYFTTGFGEHQYGLSFFLGATISQQINTGNDWSSASCYQYEARYPGNQSIAQTSAPFTASSALAASPTSPSGWFNVSGSDPECGESPFACNATNPEEPGDHPTTVTADDLRALESASDLLEAEQRFEQQRYLYAKLKAYPSLVTWSIPVTSFYNSMAVRFIGDLYEVDKQYAELFDLPEPLASDYSDQLDELRDTLDRLYGKYAEYLTETNPTKKAAALADLNDLVEDVSEFGNALETIELDVAEELEDRFEDLLTANTALSPSELIEANEQTINELLFRAVVSPDEAFNSTERETIDDMAALCPDYDGTAVYKARHLQTLYSFNNAYDDENCTAAPREPVRPAPPVSNGMVVYPNPAIDFATVQLGVPLSAEGRLTLVDWRGRVVHESRLPAHAGLTTFALRALPPGIYTLYAYAGEERIEAIKLAVLH